MSKDITVEAKKISMGDSVKIRLADGTVRDFKIVTSHEACPEKGLVSDISPIGKSILGASVGQTREYKVNGKVFQIDIIS